MSVAKLHNRKKVIPIENYISKILDIVDDDSTVIDVHIEGSIKYVTIMKNIHHDLVCPICGSKLNSKGLFRNHPKHQILQDGYTLVLTLIGRRWKCSNKNCNYTCHDQFKFVEPHKQTTKIIPIQIVMELKDIKLSCVQVAKQFQVSDTYVHQTFMKYVNLPRKPLTEHICIDEVYLNLSPSCKYALVIMDFISGEILDIVESRRENTTQSYFLSIPKEERDRVKFLCCDMYNPYINYTTRYFLNAVPITDSFHVLQWILNKIQQYIKKVKRRYQDLDKKRLEEKNFRNNTNFKTIEESDELYILRKASWVLLRNRSNWFYVEKHTCTRLGRTMDTYDWENAFLDIDPNFRAIRNYKDLYEEFNESFVNDLDGASNRLDELIEIYSNCEYSIFREFAHLLCEYHDSIINSFTYVKAQRKDKQGVILRRLSNGPMESFNNLPSGLRTQSHGIKNFEFARNRLLWSSWDDAPIKAVPRSNEQIRHYGSERGPYKK